MPTYANNLKRRIGWDYRTTQSGTSKWVWETITQSYKYVGYSTTYTHQHPLWKLVPGSTGQDTNLSWTPNNYNQSTAFDSLWGTYTFFGNFLYGYTEDYTLNSSDNFVFDFVAFAQPPSFNTGFQDNAIFKLYKADVNGYPSWLEFGVTTYRYFSSGNKIEFKYYVKEKTVVSFEQDYYSSGVHRWGVSQTTLAEDSQFSSPSNYPLTVSLQSFINRMKVVRNGNKIEFWRNGIKQFDITKTAETYYNYSFDPYTLYTTSFYTNGIIDTYLYLDEIQLRVNNLTASDLTATVSPIKDNWFGTVSESSAGTLTCQPGFLYDESFNLNTPSTISADSVNNISSSQTLLNEYNISTTANNRVGFPELTQIYIEPGYVETGAQYAGNAVNDYDYVLDGYYTVDYIEEATLQIANSSGANISDDNYFGTETFVPSVTMLQSFVSESTVPNVLMGQIVRSEANVSSQSQTTVSGIRARQLEASVASETTASFSGGRIFDIDKTLQSETNATIDSGRLQQIAADLLSQTQQTSVPFLLKGGLGIVAGASAVFTEGGYLQSSGGLNFNAQADIVLGNNVNSNTGIILKGFEVDANSESTTLFNAGKVYTINESLLSQSQVIGVPGYLWTGEADLINQSAIIVDGGISFLAPQAFIQSQFTVPNTLAGFRLLGITTLVSNNFQLAVGKKWLVDPYRRLIVDPETRLTVIPLETSLFRVDMENRLNTIIEETKNIIVKQETRKYHIPQAPIVFVSDTRTERV